MKRTIALLTAVVLVLLSVTGCGFLGSSEKTLTSEGLSITLTGRFSVDDTDLSSVNTFVTTAFTSPLDGIAVYACREYKDEINVADDFDASDYLDFFTTNLPDTAEEISAVKAEDGVEYFDYISYIDGQNMYFQYLNTTYESDDAFWILQFCCRESDYEKNKPDFIKWAKTVTFS